MPTEVCSECFSEDCWQGRLYCENYRTAGCITCPCDHPHRQCSALAVACNCPINARILQKELHESVVEAEGIADAHMEEALQLREALQGLYTAAFNYLSRKPEPDRKTVRHKLILAITFAEKVLRRE